MPPKLGEPSEIKPLGSLVLVTHWDRLSGQFWILNISWSGASLCLLCIVDPISSVMSVKISFLVGLWLGPFTVLPRQTSGKYFFPQKFNLAPRPFKHFDVLLDRLATVLVA